MPSAWIEALKEWNAKHNAGTWCVPRKGSKDLEEARAIMARIKKERGEKVEAAPAPKARPKVKMATPEVQAKFAEAMKTLKEKESKTAKVKDFLKKALEKRRAKKTEEAKPKSRVIVKGKVMVKKPKKEGKLEDIATYMRLKDDKGMSRDTPESQNFGNRIGDQIVIHGILPGKEGESFHISKAIEGLNRRHAQKNVGIVKSELRTTVKYLEEIKAVLGDTISMATLETLMTPFLRHWGVSYKQHYEGQMRVMAHKEEKKASKGGMKKVEVAGVKMNIRPEDMAELERLMNQ